MTLEIVILSSEKLLTRLLVEFFKSKGAEVRLLGNERAIGPSTRYLVIVNTDGRYSRRHSLLEKLGKAAPKTVVINSASDDGFKTTAAPIKQIFVDNVFPVYTKSAHEAYKLATGPSVYLPARAWMTIATLEQTLDKVAEELFSFSQNRKILLGKLVSYREVAGLVRPSAEVFVNVNAPQRLPKAGMEVQETHINLADLLSVFEGPELKESRKPRPPSFRVPKWPVAFVLLAISIAVAVPYLLIIISGIAGTGAYRFLKAERFQAASNALFVANIASTASWQMLSSAQILPFAETAGVISRSTGAAGRVLAISDYVHEFTLGIVGEGESANLAQGLYLELTALYQDLSFLNGDLGAGGLPFVGTISELKNLSEYRRYVLAASELARELPALLGYDKPKTYMVLLQNNMELRPTGGFIGSFALLTFSKGELIDNTVYDVYSADGQLKGYIEPPAPIVEHLGEASWTLRDSNWDPDFPSSAARAEWFLDKSIDRQVDGVFAVNLEVARKYLEVLGSISLPDFGHTIDSKNMYEKVQYEVENGFFPGSRKKAHYLSSLMEAIIGRIKGASFAESLGLLQETVGRLDARDIQVYLHEDSLQKTFSEQKWDGGVATGGCYLENCAGVFAGVVEANLGVNKANYFIKRMVSLKTEVKESVVGSELTLTLENMVSGRDKIPEQRYKVYVRAVAPVDSQFEDAVERLAGRTSFLDADVVRLDNRMEYGVLVEVLPGEKKEVVFKWSTPVSLDFEKAGAIRVSWWKQSGSGDYPLDMYVEMPQTPMVKSSPPFRLTEGGGYHYNTTLSRDLGVEFSWKPQ